MGTGACCCLGDSRRMRVGSPVCPQAKHRHQLHRPGTLNSGTLSIANGKRYGTRDIIRNALSLFFSLHKQVFLPLVRRSKGRIVLVSSLLARIPSPVRGIYCALKVNFPLVTTSYSRLSICVIVQLEVLIKLE